MTTSERCCSCNGNNALCKSCSCVNGGRPCLGCLPSKKGRCHNDGSRSSQKQVSSVETIPITNYQSIAPFQSDTCNPIISDFVTHEIKCTNENCSLYTVIRVPVRISREFFQQDFLCGTCAASKISYIMEELKKQEGLIKSLESDFAALKLSIPESSSQHIENISKRSFAEVVRREVTRSVIAASSASVQNNSPLNIIKACESQAKRSNTVIIRNLPISEDEQKSIQALFREIGFVLPADKKFSFFRLPAKRSDVPPWLLISLDGHYVDTIIRSAHRLKSSVLFQRVYIQPNLSPAEREIQNALRAELKKKRLADPSGIYRIRNTRVLRVGETTTSTEETRSGIEISSPI